MDTDRALMRRVRERDEVAFTELVTRHGGRMLTVATRLLGSRADGEDAVQRAFLRCFSAAGSYRAEWAVSTWLYRILTNVCFDEIRRRRARPEISGALEGDPPADDGGRRPGRGTPGDRRAGRSAAARGPEAQESRIDIQRALLRVPDEARALLILRYADGLSYGELARVRGISVNTVKSQLARGKSKLRAALREDGP